LALRDRLLIIAVLFMLSACEQNTVIQARYECEGGKILNATFTNGEEVSIDIEGQAFNIARAEATSGAKYESKEEGISFWSKGIDAIFIAKTGATPLKCRRR
jgi:membrane-bound inhibitor of C-type lysozyme